MAGSLAALGVAGTALASGSDDARPKPTVSASTRAELSVSRDEAAAIAVRAAGGGTVESVEREAEHGRVVWDVDVLAAGVEHDIDVDAASGTVLRHRIGDDDRGRRAEPGDDRGRGVEAGDDHGGDRGRGAEAGDDRGQGVETGDDHGGDRGRGAEAGDDHGGHGHGADD
ncbi:PepSY domain-containing protein [Actinoplanes sp. KI2]|uniref:PepSY domain-containing protein n=1 Tax=Actinoplanes sp. KI2 TaxID=2983315 RepID=UPI0021D58611|nr:PepSY domain-containing protein [Actinoplanes sp. KI2]MCU7723103.1 PepSY domain-containing protein [Actinoplanes sp. KI2]